MEIYNAWVDQAWDYEMPLDDSKIDSLYPWYQSGDCSAWPSPPPECSIGPAMPFWDETLRARKRPVYGLADDDGFVYTGDSDEPVYEHGRKDSVQTDTPSWFRFGVAWVMVDVPSAAFSAADVSQAVDQGKFYASSGVDLNYDTSGDVIVVSAGEPVIFGAVGGAGSETGSVPLAGFNLTLCKADGDDDVVTNIGCSGAVGMPPPLATQLRVDLREIGENFFYVRIQAHVRTRYPIASVPNGKKWEFCLGTTPKDVDFMEGRLVRATGKSRRPFVVQSFTGTTVQVVSHFSDGDGDITPDKTTLDGIVAGHDELVAERWAWMQPIFRRTSNTGKLEDAFPHEAESVHV